MAQTVLRQKLLDCINVGVEKHGIPKDSVFRFSIVDGSEKGMLLCVLGAVSEDELKKKVQDKTKPHRYGICDITKQEYYCLA